MLRFTVCSLTILLLVAHVPAATAPTTVPSAPEVKAAVERSLGFIETKGVAWLDKNKCIACHHGEWMMWGLNEAQHAGISVDPKKLDVLGARVDAMYLSLRAQYEKNKSGYVEGTYMLMGQYGDVPTDAKNADWPVLATSRIVAAQRADGSWKYAGQGLDRPDIENDEATTLWALLALAAHPKAESPEAAAREKALGWLKNAEQGPSIDAVALRLAVELHGGDAARAAALKDELLKRQNEDGGFSWTPKRASDAFATGESLYVLSLAGVKSDSPAIGKAWKFLLSTQLPDGSWLCISRKPKGGTEISSYWGTTWAVIGLSRSLPSTAVTEAR